MGLGARLQGHGKDVQVGSRQGDQLELNWKAGSNRTAKERGD